MIDNSSLRQLRERIAELAGPDREVDEELRIAFGADPALEVGLGGRAEWLPEPYTASIDAALALVERICPSYLWVLKRGFTPSFMMWHLETDRTEWPEFRAPTAPLAILLALLDTKLQSTAGPEAAT